MGNSFPSLRVITEIITLYCFYQKIQKNIQLQNFPKIHINTQRYNYSEFVSPIVLNIIHSLVTNLYSSEVDSKTICNEHIEQLFLAEFLMTLRKA